MNQLISHITFAEGSAFVATYFFCAIPFGVVLSKLFFKKDVRTQGSGNIGATNVARMMGKKWGVAVLFLDALKGFLPVFLSLRFWGQDVANTCAVIAVIGHCYPIYLKFKGGKGVATALGVVLALSPSLVAMSAAVFFIVIVTMRVISAASLSAAVALFFFSFLFSHTRLSTHGLQPWAAAVITILVWWKHKENIKRLVRNEEPKFF